MDYFGRSKFTCHDFFRRSLPSNTRSGFRLRVSLWAGFLRVGYYFDPLWVERGLAVAAVVPVRSLVWRRQRVVSGGEMGGALHILHHQIVGTDIVKLADLGVVQDRDGAGYAVEAFSERLQETLMATKCSSRVSRTFQTSPMPPTPRGATIA
jgi:hypothetical protein